MSERRTHVYKMRTQQKITVQGDDGTIVLTPEEAKRVAVALTFVADAKEDASVTFAVVEDKKKKQTHLHGHALCQACEEGRPDGDPEHDRWASHCAKRGG